MKIEACYDHSTKINIVLIVPDDLFNGNPECGDSIHNSREVAGVKVKLPLNLKNMREVHSVTCEVPAYAACQVCICMPAYMCMHTNV